MQNDLLGVRLDSEKRETLYEKVISLTKKDRPSLVVRPNAEIITYAQNNPEFKAILNSALVSIPDGIGVLLASRLLGVKVAGRFGGPESMFEILKLTERNNLGVYLLGSRAEVVKLAASNIKKALPRLNLVGFHDGYFQKNEEIIAEINRLRPAVIFVGLGSPTQEKWVYKNLSNFYGGVFVMEGGSFDYLAGKITRAPTIFQKLGLEWLVRLVNQPWRFFRQIKLFKFIYLVLRKKLTQK